MCVCVCVCLYINLIDMNVSKNWRRQYLVNKKESRIQLWQMEVGIKIVFEGYLKNCLFHVFEYIKITYKKQN